MATPASGSIDDKCLGTVTDLYQITMAAAMHEDGSADDLATYNLFVRKLPKGRNYLVAAGLEQAVHYLQNVRFSDEDIAYLRSQPVFKDSAVSDGFWERLRNFKFTGELRAVPEGTLIFGNEPILSITAPRIEAQLVETYLLATINFQTMIATKAAQIVDAAQGRPVIEFGLRRAHGPAAGVLASRAAYIGGCSGTSNVYAGRLFGIPISGTMAHAYVMSKGAETQAFTDYAKAFPNYTVALVDTYDTVRGTQRAIAMVGKNLKGVRTDSGTLEQMADECKQMRKLLDDAGLGETKIIVSNDMNEEKIRKLLALGAPIDSFGVGTELVTSKDAPALGGVYKLVEDVNGPKIKLSAEKMTYPGKQQVWRELVTHGYDKVTGMEYVGDTIALEGEHAHGTPLLRTYLKDSKRVKAEPPIRFHGRGRLSGLAYAQEWVKTQLALLPAKHRSGAEAYPVNIGHDLGRLVEELKQHYGKSGGA